MVNPYIAFRRREPKVQTRKKQKAEVQHYEKMLRLDLTMKKSQTLAEMIKKREKTKLYAIGMSESVLERQFAAGDRRNAMMDSLVAKVRPMFQMPEVPAKRRTLENGKVQPLNDVNRVNLHRIKLLSLSRQLQGKAASQQRKRRPTYRKNRVCAVPSTSTFTDANVVSQDWLQKNAEVSRSIDQLRMPSFSSDVESAWTSINVRRCGGLGGAGDREDHPVQRELIRRREVPVQATEGLPIPRPAQLRDLFGRRNALHTNGSHKPEAAFRGHRAVGSDTIPEHRLGRNNVPAHIGPSMGGRQRQRRRGRRCG